MQFNYASKFFDSQSEYLDSVKAKGSASVNLFIASATASIEVHKSKSEMNNAVNMQSKHGVQYGIMRLADESLQLSPSALDVLQKQGRAAFQRKYGNYFCYALTVGADHDAVLSLRIKETSSDEGSKVSAKIKVLFVTVTFTDQWSRSSYHKKMDYEKIEVYTLDLPNSSSKEGKNINISARSGDSDVDLASIITGIKKKSAGLAKEVGKRWKNYPGPPVLKYFFMPYYFLSNYVENVDAQTNAPQSSVIWQSSPYDVVYDVLREYTEQFKAISKKVDEYEKRHRSTEWRVIKAEVDGVTKRLARLKAASPPQSPLDDASIPTPCETLVRMEALVAELKRG
mmetsp:Transcript_2067/g.7370  ORF Transcript_2067/g.7370 Transcript_2067/m.7370 type:complete len:341 (-) Transcript_2067:37-1059(-)